MEDLVTYTDASGQAWIVIADTGDNAQRRDDVQLILVPDPDLSATRVVAAGVVNLTWADGSQDVESLIVDLLTGDATPRGRTIRSQ